VSQPNPSDRPWLRYVIIKRPMISTRIILKSYDSSWGGVCRNCLFTLPVLDRLAPDYFEGRPIVCENCHQPVDLWECTLSQFRTPEVPFLGLISAGSTQSGFLFNLAAGQSKELDLTEYGVPSDALILDVSFTPQGGNCLPLMVHGNRAYTRTVGTKFWVYGRPILDCVSEPGRISARVVWVKNHKESPSGSYLLDALDAAAGRRWSNVVLSSYIAFEVSLMPLVTKSMQKFISKKRIENLPPNEISSSSAWNVLLPLLLAANSVPTAPEPVSDALNGARKLRNRIVHEGLLEPEVNENAAGQALCASLFGLAYLRYVSPRLLLENPQSTSVDPETVL
jgi:hypothetical protein